MGSTTGSILSDAACLNLLRAVERDKIASILERRNKESHKLKVACEWARRACSHSLSSVIVSHRDYRS